MTYWDLRIGVNRVPPHLIPLKLQHVCSVGRSRHIIQPHGGSLFVSAKLQIGVRLGGSADAQETVWETSQSETTHA